MHKKLLKSIKKDLDFLKQYSAGKPREYFHGKRVGTMYESVESDLNIAASNAKSFVSIIKRDEPNEYKRVIAIGKKRLKI